MALAYACVAKAETAIEEIVVTALKRETALSVTPIAISVLSGDDLEDIGARDFNSYFRQVPGLTTLDAGSGRKRYIIRGVNNLSSGLSQATVAQYVDEVPITNNFDQQPDPYLIDIERVEVLRGPQGTLFGARSMAGTVRTITRKPVMERTETKANTNISDTKFGNKNVNADVTVNVPISETSAVRVSAFYSFENGYVDNAFAGGTFIPNPAQIPPNVRLPPPVTLVPIYQDNFSDIEYYGARTSWRWKPSDRITIDLMGFGQKGKIAAAPFYDVGITGNESDGLKTAVIGESGNNDTLYIATATIQYDFDWANLTAVTSYSDRDNFVLGAANAAGALFGGGPGSTLTFGSNPKSWTFEGRLASAQDEPLQWIVGGYGFTQNRTGRSREYIGFGNVTVVDALFSSHTDELAAFGEVSYDPIELITLTVGARYSDYRNNLQRTYIVPPPNTGFAVGRDPNVPRFSADTVTLRFVGDYRPTDDTLIYAVVSEGFRPGGFNPNAIPGFTTIPAEFESDQLWNYEIGAKITGLNKRLIASGALYRIDWKNMQVESQTRAPIGPAMLSYTTNASSARIEGLELEMRAQMTDTITASFAYSHFFKSELTANAPVSPIGLAPRAGDKLPGNAKNTFSIGGEYRRPLTARMDVFARVDASYTGARTTGFRSLLDNGQPNNAYNSFGDYALMNIRFGTSQGAWQITTYVENLMDARPIMQQRNFAPLPVMQRVTSKPRTVGVALSTSL
jgi:outer membrane receptor protein involved in Fe transport